MGYGKGKSEGGQGGKLGHSGMNHRDPTEWVKEQSKVWRRQQDKKSVENIDLPSREVEFEIAYNRELTGEEQTEIWVDFIETIEKQHLYYGGGDGPYSLKGCIDLSESKLIADEVIQLLMDFADKHKEVVEDLTAAPCVDAGGTD